MMLRHQFQRLWNDSSAEEKDAFLLYLKAADKEGCRAWIQLHPSLDLTEKPLSQLKEIAAKLRIKNYSRKGKLELVRDIESKEKQYGSQQGVHAG